MCSPLKMRNQKLSDEFVETENHWVLWLNKFQLDKGICFHRNTLATTLHSAEAFGKCTKLISASSLCDRLQYLWVNEWHRKARYLLRKTRMSGKFWDQSGKSWVHLLSSTILMQKSAKSSLERKLVRLLSVLVCQSRIFHRSCIPFKAEASRKLTKPFLPFHSKCTGCYSLWSECDREIKTKLFQLSTLLILLHRRFYNLFDFKFPWQFTRTFDS